MYYFFLINWLFILVLNIFCVSKIKYNNLSFIDGFIIGLLYYISIPMIFICYFDEIDTIFNLEAYRPSVDVVVTLNLMLGAYIVIIVWFFLSRNKNNHSVALPNNTKKWTIIFILSYFFFSILSFLLSGKMAGGHWHETTTQAFNESTTFVIVAGFSNVIRTCAFGGLLFLVENKILSRYKAISLGLLIVIFDIFTSFNRITGVYFIIMLLIMYRKYSFRIFLSLILGFPLIFFISSLWPVFRGMALVDGYNLDSFKNALEVSLDSLSTNFSTTLNDFLFPIFESANIVAYKYVIENSGTIALPFLWGETYIVRSTLFFIPTTIWTDKPPVFSAILGNSLQGGGAINSTAFGEVYTNFGLLWPIVFILNLIFLNFLFKRLQKWFKPACFCGAFVAFALWRFDATFMGTSVFFILLFIFLKIISNNFSKYY